MRLDLKLGDLAELLNALYGFSFSSSNLSVMSRGRNTIVRGCSPAFGDVVVKIAEGEEAVSRLRREALAAQRLGSSNHFVLPPILTLAGAPIGISPSSVGTFVTPYVQSVPLQHSPAAFSILGGALARLHRELVAKDWLEELAIPHFDPRLVLEESAQVLQGSALSPTQKHRLKVCSAFLMHRVACIDQTALVWCPIHGDAHPRNLLAWQANWVWIDLEDVALGPRVYDIATMVWSTLRERQTERLWRPGLQAYQEVWALSPEELASIPVFVGIRHLWWLALHARAWGDYDLHRLHPRLLDDGVQLLELICRDACGMDAA